MPGPTTKLAPFAKFVGSVSASGSPFVGGFG